jgi:phage terminase large subunit-like protein
MAVEEVKTTKDKTTRLMEKQIQFENHDVYFVPETTTELVDELLVFPN